jgi:hypothetical protein
MDQAGAKAPDLGMGGMLALVKRHPLATFFVLAYALSWWAWIPYARGLFPNPVASFGPFLLRSWCWH